MSVINSEPNKPSRKYTLEERRQYVEQWRTSALTRSEFCRREGLALQTFCYWVKSQQPKQETKSPLSFVSMAAVPMNSHGPRLEIILPNGLRCNFIQAIDSVMVIKMVKELWHVTHD